MPAKKPTKAAVIAENEVLRARVEELEAALSHLEMLRSRASDSDERLATVDLSEAKRAERARRDSEEEYRGLFESAMDALVLIGMDGAILDVNPAACSLYEYSREDFLRLSISDILSSDCRSLFAEAVETLAEEKSFSAEPVSVRSDGTSFPGEVRLSFVPYRGRDATLAAVRDITDLRHERAAHSTLISSSCGARWA